MQNLYERIQHEMQTDDEDTDKISRKLETYYTKQCYPDCQDAIDEVFMTLTGWTLDTLIKNKQS